LNSFVGFFLSIEEKTLFVFTKYVIDEGQCNKTWIGFFSTVPYAVVVVVFFLSHAHLSAIEKNQLS
jgi:hypothetical protein